MSKTSICRGFLVVAVALVAGCASSGPVEVLDDQEGEDVSCFRASSCVEKGGEAYSEGRIGQAVPYLIEGCERGVARGCRMLAAAYALGSIGEPDLERAESLYRWGCDEAEDGPSCHGLGELVRLGLIADDENDGGAGYFRRACELGERAGCHDEAVVELEEGEAGDEDEERILEVFRRECGQGLDVGCLNQAYMTAAGRGTGRDHGEAAKLFDEVCESGDENWRAHPLTGLSGEVDPDLYAVAEYSPEVACEQLEILIVGGYEDRVMGAVDAETEHLRECYDEARPEGRRAIGRITMRAGVTEDGRGVSPRIVDDELGLDEVAECVEERVLARHLEDYSDGETPYETEWGISFVHPPVDERFSESDAGVGSCDGEAIQREVGEIFSDLRGCGNLHLESHPDDPGAVVARWTMSPSGSVADVEMTTTTRQGRLDSCLEETISRIEIPAFDGDPCPVQVPFLFSSGERLHFSVVGN